MKKVGLIELQAIKLVDNNGANWTALRRQEPLVSKQILLPQVESCGYQAELINLKEGDEEIEFGTVVWRDKTLTKVLVGKEFDLDPRSMDLWAVTINYIQEREPACRIIRRIKQGGGQVVVGGSDAFADPDPYLQEGADAVVQDKSGAANQAILDHFLATTNGNSLNAVKLADGRQFKRNSPMSPERWPLPKLETVKACLGIDYWETKLPDNQVPIGSVMADIGCDRHCDFCATPLYKLGYRPMTPETTLKWFATQKEAGARSVICPSDQFLGRVLLKGGREDILEIMQGIRDLDLVVLWGNGLELKKATVALRF